MTALLKTFACIGMALGGIAFAACGGIDPEESCEIRCRKSVECQPGALSEDACTKLCLDQAKDEAYAEALADQSECYESSTCSQISSGQCDPKDL